MELVLHPLDDLSARADDHADLLRVDLGANNLGCVLGDVRTRFVDRLEHDLEDVQSALARLTERGRKNLLADPAHLDVHLQRRHAVLGSGDLQIHVAAVVLTAQDIAEDGDVVSVDDQSHRDSGHRTYQGHARVHQRQRRAAHRRLRTRPVGLRDVRHHADCVGKRLGIGQHRSQRPLGQGAVSDLAPSGPSDHLRFVDGPRREIVVQHEGLVVVVHQAVHLLLVRAGPQRHRHDRLRLAAREERRPVGPGQQPHLACDSADVRRASPVGALSAENPFADDVGLDVVEDPLDRLGLLGGVVRVRVHQRLDRIVADRLDGVAAVQLAGNHVGFAHSIRVLRRNLFDERLVDVGLGDGLLLLAALRDKLVDHRADLPQRLIRQGQACQHDLLRHLFRARLDHADAFARAGHDQVQSRCGQLLLRRVDDVLVVDVSNPDGAHAGAEGDARQTQRCAGGDHRQDVRIVLAVGRQHDRAHLDFLLVRLGKEGADGPVGQPHRQDFFLGGASFTLEEAAGDLSRCRHLLAVVHGQGEEIDSLPRVPVTGRRQHDGVAAAHHHGAVRLSCHFSGFNR